MVSTEGGPGTPCFHRISAFLTPRRPRLDHRRHMHPRARAWSLVTVVLGLAVTVGLAVSSCGPKEKFCPNTPDGVCQPPMDASVVDMGVEAGPKDALFIGADTM